ncbi:MAG: helix-turn-helix domain-containing protein [Oscillospiraceae bacterium]|nr:helix-turn-helix domain-containing protein [Oscillospiraceae bacterium]
MLNERIKSLRKANGLTQVELAKKINVSKQCVSNWENNNIQPSIDMLVKLADFFSVSTDYLLCLDERRILDVTGLTDIQIEHIRRIIDDIRE